jgi:hypothetical protein
MKNLFAYAVMMISGLRELSEAINEASSVEELDAMVKEKALPVGASRAKEV